MSAAAAELLRLAALSAAFWVALALPLREPALRRHGTRLAVGLGLGALAAHAGVALLHLGSLDSALAWDPTRGQSLLFVPLGLLAVTRAGALRRAALRAQPAAWALAKLGCLAPGCCGGGAPALAEAGAYALVYAASAAVGAGGPATLGALAAARGLLGGLRPDAVETGGIDARFVAAGWVAWALAAAARARRAQGPCAPSASRATRLRASISRRTTAYSPSLNEKRRNRSAPMQ